MRVNVVCRNLKQDRVIPRFARYLADGLGWTVSASPRPGFDVVYLSGYFESQMCQSWPRVPVAAYFTHREEQPPGNGKAKLFDAIAERVDLRIVTAPMYRDAVERFGPTALMPAPVERKRFTIPKREKRRQIVAGFSGYTYRNKRKGEDLVAALLSGTSARNVEWRASGRGWPVHTTRYKWDDMPSFYQALDVLVVPSRVEGVPMPPLEALSCGVSVVIPRGVGMLDDLPDLPGIHRYNRGNGKSLIKAFNQAVRARNDVDREVLRAATEPYNVQAWVDAHEAAFEETFGTVDAGLAGDVDDDAPPVEIEEVYEPLKNYDTGSTRGIYVVAFGLPARKCAVRLMSSIKKYMPEIPIALCADRKIGLEDILIKQPDSDVGGRRAKLKAYQLAPAEWESVLYLDADTEVVADIRFYFQLIEDGWEFVICKDPHLMDTMFSFRRRYNQAELEETESRVHTLHTLQYNGGVWAFARNDRVRRFFARWLKEWERHAQRDQGALIRAMYTEPLRVYLLGNEWNTFPKYTKGIKTAGLMHYPGDARRWNGFIRGRIDSAEAWAAVKRFHDQRRGDRRQRGHQRYGGRRG